MVNFWKKKKKEVPEMGKSDSAIYLDIGTESIKLAFVDKKKKIFCDSVPVSLDNPTSVDYFSSSHWKTSAAEAIGKILDKRKYADSPIHFTRRSGQDVFLRSISKCPEDITKKDLIALAPVQQKYLRFDTCPSFGGDASHSLVGMTSRDFVIKSVALFGNRHLERVASFFPSSLSFVRRYENMAEIENSEGQREAGLFLDVGFRGSSFVIVSPDGAVFDRFIAVGFLQLAKKIMDENDLDFQTARQMLEKEAVLDNRSLQYQIMDEALKELTREIKKGLSFFSTDVSLLPIHTKLWLCGGAGRMKNLDTELKKRLGLEIEYIQPLDEKNGNFGTLSSLLQKPAPPEINLLRNTKFSPDSQPPKISESPDTSDSDGGTLYLTYGGKKDNFRVDDYLSEREGSKPEQKAEDVEAPLKERQSTPGGRQAPTRGASSFFSGKKRKESAPEEDDPEKKRRNRVVAGGLIFMALFWGYQGYLGIEDMQKKRGFYVSKYVENTERLDRLKGKQGLSYAPEVVSSDNVDKNFWVEKLLYIGKEINKEIWLTSIILEKGGGGGKDSSDETQERIVLNGLVIKSTEGHLRIVADFMSRLIKNKKFMRDFKEITFEGLQIGEGGIGEKVTFTLYCWYQRGAHKAKEEEPGKEEKGKGGMAGEALKKMKDKVKVLDDIDGLSKGKSVKTVTGE